MTTEKNNVLALIYLTEKILADVNYTNNEKDILKKGLNDIFKTYKEYENRCSELYNGIDNMSEDKMYLELEEDNEEECIGCETGADCISAHCYSCNKSKGFI